VSAPRSLRYHGQRYVLAARSVPPLGLYQRWVVTGSDLWIYTGGTERGVTVAVGKILVIKRFLYKEIALVVEVIGTGKAYTVQQGQFTDWIETGQIEKA